MCYFIVLDTRKGFLASDRKTSHLLSDSAAWWTLNELQSKVPVRRSCKWLREYLLILIIFVLQCDGGFVFTVGPSIVKFAEEMLTRKTKRTQTIN